MNIRVEMSLYPLEEKFEATILDFVARLRKNPHVEVRTNELSTQLFGEYDAVMGLMQSELRPVLEQRQAVLVAKIVSGPGERL